MYVCKYEYIYICIYACIYMYMYMYVCMLYMYVCMVCMYVCMYVCIRLIKFAFVLYNKLTYFLVRLLHHCLLLLLFSTIIRYQPIQLS